MTNTPLPFDALRPFKSKAEEFTPRDTIPWETQAEQFLRYETAEGFMGLRPLPEIEAHVAWLVEHLALPPGAAILDLGCGPGLYSNRLAKHGYRVTGIDIAQPLLDYAQAEAREQGLTSVYRRLSIFDLPYQAEFEAVLLINSIAKCLTQVALEAVLRKIHTALKPGGHLICEFAPQPDGFDLQEPTVTESISFLAQSPWHNSFHAWMIRELTFPSGGERVTHHLILGPDGQPAEYWSRFCLYSIPVLTDLLSACGFQVRTVFGQTPSRPLEVTDNVCFVWAQRDG